MRRLALPAFLALSAMLVPISVLAHPHVWIDYAATAQMSKDKIVAVREEWTFVKKFPFSLVGDLSDAPISGPMDPKHTAIIRSTAAW